MTNAVPRRSKRLLFLIVVALLLGLALGRYTGFTLIEWWRDLHSGVVLSRARTSEKVVALTFDDGPDPKYTPRVLDILHRYSIHATFFDQGRLVEKYPEIVQRTVAEGNVLGNHTFSHPYITRLAPQAIRAEMLSGGETLHRASGVSTGLFRPPRGDWNPTVYAETIREGDHLILWTLALEHHDTPTPEAMAQRILDRVRPGDILLMHDGAFVSREATVAALPLLIEGLRRKGYRCVTVPELLHIPASQTLPAGSKG